MADFSKYGGASREWKAVEAAFPSPAPDGASVLEKRTAANANREKTSAALMTKLADKVELIDVSIPARDGFALEGRLYWPKSVPKDAQPALYLHLHGGGYLFGTLSSEDAICSNLAINTSDKGTPLVVLNLNYRHTPGWTYPTAWLDAQDGLAWIHATAVPQFGVDPAKVVVGGISAGAHITATLVLEQHLGKLPVDVPRVAGQVLMIPALVNSQCYEPQLAQLASPDVSSLVENEFAPILPVHIAHFFTDLLKVPAHPRVDDTFLSPGNATAEQVQGLPPTVFGICGLDPLRDQGLLYAKLLAEKAGVPTNVHLYRGVPHGFRRYGPDWLSVSRDWDATMEDGIAWALKIPTATNTLDIIVHGEETM
ncbi:hypothetical protein HMPREF1624_03627 [Sporothrix schenckii ATCC 58251]|uniref:Alpha/beta hydrolase fold-3 domain-containing protein n=1 Tax=Sporothrix schenckii (strain ATCC 58251 / de Perez 2211183) TaxID=1391915 RepID=U7Q0J7_SPOS1|nr:hypothetical protein HMPREF1624_03627 [Sporothrix schenckii ATCC 58251]